MNIKQLKIHIMDLEIILQKIKLEMFDNDLKPLDNANYLGDQNRIALQNKMRDFLPFFNHKNRKS